MALCVPLGKGQGASSAIGENAESFPKSGRSLRGVRNAKLRLHDKHPPGACHMTRRSSFLTRKVSG
jgi:hypothetical protein